MPIAQGFALSLEACCLVHRPASPPPAPGLLPLRPQPGLLKRKTAQWHLPHLQPCSHLQACPLPRQTPVLCCNAHRMKANNRESPHARKEAS